MNGTDTITGSLRAAAGTLATHSESPRLDAELLLGKVLGLTRSGLIVHGTAPVTAAGLRAFSELVERRARGIPVAYLLGTREFWSLGLGVGPAVLVPRPETEVLVELALQRVAAASSVLDLGTGSGAIALAIAAERPHARIVATDVSTQALDVARSNAVALGLPQVDFRAGSWFEAVSADRFDVIVANPPYLAADDAALETLAAEPRLALVSGATGLEALHAIIDAASAHLNPDGALLLEHGSAQSDAVAHRLRLRGFTGIRSHDDHAGKPRVTLGSLFSTLQEHL